MRAVLSLSLFLLIVGCGRNQPPTQTSALTLSPPTSTPSITAPQNKTHTPLEGKLPSQVLGICFSADGKIIAALDSTDTVRIWDSETGPGRELPRSANPNYAAYSIGGRDIRFTPDGTKLCWPTTWGLVEVWDWKTKSKVSQLKGAVSLASDVRTAFDKDGYLITKRINGFVAEAVRWDIGSGKDIKKSEVGGDSTLHADGVTYSGPPHRLKENELPIYKLDGQLVVAINWQGTTSSTHITNQSGSVFVATDGRTVQVHDLPSGQQRFSLSSPESLDHSNNVRYAVAISADGSKLAVPRGKEIVIYDTRKGVKLESISQEVIQANSIVGLLNVTAMAFSPDGKRLATGWTDGTVRVHALSTKSSQPNNPLAEHLINKNKGEIAVKESIAVVKTIFDDAELFDVSIFLERIARAESNLGLNNKTFREGYYGGIWQVDKIGFNATKDVSSHPKLTRLHASINKAYTKPEWKALDWKQVKWEDLTKPVYSCIAARLYLATIPESIPTSLEDQARYWKKYYNKTGDGTVEHFINANKGK